MPERIRLPFWHLVAAGVLLLSLGGCGSVVSSLSSGMADNLSGAMLNQDDPELVREALPAYLLMLDSLLESDPDSVPTLSASAQLYSAYASTMIDDPERARVLTTRARNYGSRALCAADSDTCDLQQLDFDAYEAVIQSVDADELTALYSYSVSSLAWIRAHSDDFKALAELPKVEVALQQVMKLEPGEYAASTSMYLGILATLLPEALGGDPEAGRRWFEQGIALSGGRDLSIKVEFARGYARQKYDRQLHDSLLNEVLAAPVQQPDLTLFNIMARDQATALLASADEYF
jgi:hypothetical protein